MFILYRLDSAIPWHITLLARRLLDATTDARELALAEHTAGIFILVDSRCGTHWAFSL